MPHGYCFLWNPRLVWLNALSDGLIFAAYMTIPFALVYFAHRNQNRSSRLLFYLFGLFIVSCGLTHAMDVWTLWHPDYWLSGGIKALTAVASVSTAVVLAKLGWRAFDSFDLASSLSAESGHRGALRSRRPLWLAYCLPLVTTAALLLVLEAAGPGVSSNAPVIVLLFPVMLSAYIGGFLPGLASTALAALAAAYFVLPPTHSWRVADPMDFIKLITLSAAGTLMSFLMADREHSREERAAREGRGLLASIERKVQAGFAVLLACLVGVAAVSYPAVHRVQNDEAWVAHSQQVIASLRLVLATTGDAEAGERGYIITGQDAYLAQYNSARQDVDAALRELRRLTADNAVQQGHLDFLEPMVAERMGILQSGIEARRLGFATAQAALLSGAGERVDTRIGKLADEVEANEQELLADREARTEHATAITKVVIGGGSGLAVLIVAAGLFVIGEAFKANRRDREALRRAGAYNRSLLEASVDPLVAISPEGKVTDVNSATEKITGHARLDLVGTDFSDYFTDPEKARSGYGQVFRDGSVQDYELELRHRDGHTTPVLYNASVYRRENGRVAGVFAAARDITHRKQAQQALEAERQRIFAVLETMPAMICLLTPDHYISFANRAFRERFGESEGRHCYEYCFGNTVPCQFCEAYVVLATGQPHRWELPLADGSVLEIYNIPFKDSDGSSMILEMSIDVTELKHAEAARALAAIVESSEDAIVSRNLDGMVQSWNRGAECLYGYSAGEMVGRSTGALLPEDRRGEIDSILGRIRNGESIDAYETARITKDGRLIHVSLAASPIRDAAGKLAGISMVARDITRRKQAEDALRESEDRFRTLANAIPQLCWMANADGWIFWYNQRWYEYTGATPEQMEGWGWQSVHDPEALPKVLESWKESIATGKRFEMVFPLRGVDGVFRPFLTRVLPVFDSAGAVVRWFGTNTDISGQQRAQEALRRSEAELREAQSFAHLGSWAWQLATDTVTWSAELYRIFGRDPALPGVMVGECGSFFTPESALRLQAALGAASESGTPYELDLEAVRSDGTRRWISARGESQRDAGGRVAAVRGTVLDITERKRAEEQLRESEGRFRLFVEHAPAAIAMLDCEMRYVAVSQRWLKDYHLESLDIIGHSHYEAFPGLPAHWRAIHLRCLAGAIETCEEDSFPRADGTIDWVRWEIRPWRHESGQVGGLLLFSEVVTERKRAADEIRQLNASLERRVAARTAELAAVNQELEAFTYSVAHDLRAPLRGVDGFSLALAEDYGPRLDEGAQGYITRIRSATLRMGQLIDDLLNLSRISRAELRKGRLSLSDLAGIAASELQKSSPERQVEFAIAPSLEVEGDAHLLSVVLENLLGNAWKFTAKRPQARIELGTLEKDGRQVYFIRDNGVGFDMNYAGKLFAPFQRLHSASEFPGTGIGLVTVARIIRKHGGEIWAEAAVDRGATFSFTLGADS